MASTDRDSRNYDLAIVAGTALALYWSLYVQPQNGEPIALLLGAVPLAIGLYQFVPPDRYVVEGLLGLLAVVLGGTAPPSIITGTEFGDWLVGSSPLPLSLGLALLVVLCVLVLRRALRGTVAPTADPAA